MIEKRQVKAIREILICDFCGEEMKFEGRVLTTFPPLYPHRCNSCGKSEIMKKVFPGIGYEEELEGL